MGVIEKGSWDSQVVEDLSHEEAQIKTLLSKKNISYSFCEHSACGKDFKYIISTTIEVDPILIKKTFKSLKEMFSYIYQNLLDEKDLKTLSVSDKFTSLENSFKLESFKNKRRELADH